MILCITPDHDVLRCADDTSDDQLQEMHDAECVILRFVANRDAISILEWLGAAEDVPAIGWTRIE